MSIANLLVYNSDLQGPRGRVGEWCPNLEAAICLKVLFYCCDNYHPNYFQTINYTLEYFERFLNSLSFPVYELEKFKSQIRGSGYSIKGNEFPPRLKSKPGSVKRVVEDVGLKKRTPLEQDLSREDNWSPVGISKLEMKQFLVKKDLARKAKELAFKKYLKHNNFHEICQGESHGHGDYVLCPYSLAIPLFLKFGNPLKVSQEFLKGLKFVSFGGSNRILLCEYEKGIEGRYSSLNLSKNLIFRVSGNGQA